MRKATIILPTYNEGGNIKILLEKIFKIIKTINNWDFNILVIDSKSKDNTGKIVKTLQKNNSCLYLIETEKEGLGKAYSVGFEYVIKHFNPYVVFEMDADLSHDPYDISKFLKKIEKGADFVIGSRYIKGGSIPKDWGIHRKLFSIFGNLIIRFGFMKPKITDWTSGYRAMKIWVVKSAICYVKNYSGYVFQIANIDKALKNRAKIEEIPINFSDRNAGVSKINFGQYIFQIFTYIFLNSSFIKFAIVGIFGFIVDFAISYLGIEILNIEVWIATMISTETAIICNFTFNNLWAFSHKKIKTGKKSYIFSFLKFNLISSGSIIIQTIGVAFMSQVFGKSLWYLYKVGIILFIIIPYSYFLYNKIVWKDKS